MSDKEDQKIRQKRIREKNRRLRELAKHFSSIEYWRVMNKAKLQPVVDNTPNPE